MAKQDAPRLTDFQWRALASLAELVAVMDAKSVTAVDLRALLYRDHASEARGLVSIVDQCLRRLAVRGLVVQKSDGRFALSRQGRRALGRHGW